MLGSSVAGMSFTNSSVALVHGMSRPIGAHFHVPHGLSNAMLFPAVTRFSLASAMPRYAAAARAVGFADAKDNDEKAASKLADGLAALNAELSVPGPKQYRHRSRAVGGKAGADGRAGAGVRQPGQQPARARQGRDRGAVPAGLGGECVSAATTAGRSRQDRGRSRAWLNVARVPPRVRGEERGERQFVELVGGKRLLRRAADEHAAGQHLPAAAFVEPAQRRIRGKDAEVGAAFRHRRAGGGDEPPSVSTVTCIRRVKTRLSPLATKRSAACSISFERMSSAEITHRPVSSSIVSGCSDGSCGPALRIADICARKARERRLPERSGFRPMPAGAIPPLQALSTSTSSERNCSGTVTSTWPAAIFKCLPSNPRARYRAPALSPESEKCATHRRRRAGTRTTRRPTHPSPRTRSPPSRRCRPAAAGVSKYWSP